MTKPQIKVCGVKTLSIAELALESGVDYVGMIHHPASPRHLDIGSIKALCSDLPKGRRVGVTVTPDHNTIGALVNAGVDILQVHAPEPFEESFVTVRECLPKSVHLWAAPKLPPGSPFPEALLSIADAILLDTYSPRHAGGTGKTGDWKGFAKLQQQFPNNLFILAGGINTLNVLEALQTTQCRFFDISCGLESEPGVKSPSLIREFFQKLDQNGIK